MSTFPLVVNKTMKYGEWLWDREQEAADNRALAAYDRRIEAEKAVTFVDLLEEMASFSEPRAEVFMQAYRRGTADEKHTMYVLIDQAFERCVEQRLKEAAGASRFAETYCSQCGKDLGPGDHGVSHCKHHR